MRSLNWSQIMRFLSSGVLGTLLYYIVLFCLTEYANVLYVTSSVIAGFLNWTSNFLFHKYWTFQQRELAGTHIEAGKYVVLAASLLTLNSTLLFLVVEYLKLWYIFAQLIVTVIVTTISYILTRLIFKK